MSAGLEEGAQHAVGRNRVHLDIVRRARKHAAVILRPRAVEGTADDRVADFPVAQFLRLGRDGGEGIDFLVDEELDQVVAHDPLDIVDGIEPDIGGHDDKQHVRRRLEVVHAYFPALQILDALDALGREQFETSLMHTG